MEKLPVLGLKFRVVITLAVVLALFILITELSITELTRVTMTQVTQLASENETSASTRVDQEEKLISLRRIVFFYLIIGAILALGLSAFAVNRLVITPLRKVNDALKKVGNGKLDTTIPVSGSREFVLLASAFNQMTGEIRQQRQELEKRLSQIESASKELEETQERLIRAAKLASVGTLAAGVAHEIGNPLAGLLGLIEALEKEKRDDVKERYRSLMRVEIERIDRIIRDLLAYARPNRIEGDEPRTDVKTVLSHVHSLLSAQKIFDGVQYTQSLPDVVPKPNISQDDLTQILLNVLLNAAQAMDGKGKISLRVIEKTDWRPPHGTQSRQALRIEICDTGPGISKEDETQIFDPFFSKRAGGKGTGLGLAICQSLCDRAGGEITFIRKEDQTSCFQIMLPIVIR